MVTAIGSPSGMATTITVTAIMKALTKISSSFEDMIEPPVNKRRIDSLTKRVQPMRIAKMYPKLPIRFDKSFNCFLRGVKSASSSPSSPSLLPLAAFVNCLFCPSKVLSPTAATTILP